MISKAFVNRSFNLKNKKILFAVKLLKIINKSTVLINIEKSAISDSTEANYFWRPKGVPQNLSSIAKRGSINLITAIASNEISITGNRSGTMKVDIFIEYMKHMITIWNRL